MATFYKVGGVVRDEILGVKSNDIDFVVETDSYQSLRELILARGGKIFVEYPEFLTLKANVPKIGAADFAVTRKDGKYSNGRHPESVEVGTLMDDLARRDFTMNAIAISESGDVFDPYNGTRDISSKLIKAVGNAKQRIDEDKLRAFRAIRFSVTKGFRIDPPITSAIEGLKYRDFDGVSTERIREELAKMFAHDTHLAVMLITSPSYFILWQVAMGRGIRLLPTIQKP